LELNRILFCDHLSSILHDALVGSGVVQSGPSTRTVEIDLNPCSEVIGSRNRPPTVIKEAGKSPNHGSQKIKTKDLVPVYNQGSPNCGKYQIPVRSSLPVLS
jgi:hypothetical protein